MRRVYATIIVDFYGDPKLSECADNIETALRTAEPIKGADVPVIVMAGSKFDPAMPDNPEAVATGNDRGKPS